VFTLAAITDWVDGYLARRLGQMTAFGAFLDPVADKLMVAVALVLLVERHNNLLFTLAACVIIGARSSFRRCASGWRSSASAPPSPCR
jgi:CDP-diacylglycerol--glycerol-3-phosphate 3-phosphatidyltransferase